MFTRPMPLGRQLATLRRLRSLSQQALALAAGVPQPMISRIERGDQMPRHKTLVRLARVLGAELLMSGPENREITLIPIEVLPVQDSVRTRPSR